LQKLAAEEQLYHHCTRSTSKPINVSPEKFKILSRDNVVANQRYILHSVIPMSHIMRQYM